MRKKMILALEITLALAALIAGYIFVVGRTGFDTPVAAGALTAPDNPHILYLAPEGQERGKINDEVMQDRGVTPVRSWEAVRNAAASRSLDGLLIDAALIEAASETDQAWLQAQFRQGVVIVGLGTKDEQLAQVLGVKTLRSSGEGAYTLEPTDYRIVSSLVLGHPDDVEKLEQADWLNRMISEGSPRKPLVDITRPATTSFGKSKGSLTSDEELDLLFMRITADIEGNHRARLEYQKQAEEIEEQ